MQGYITAEKVWQEGNFFGLSAACVSEIFTVKTEIYTSAEKIAELSNKINNLMEGSIQCCIWENGVAAAGAAANVSIRLCRGYKPDRIRLEAYMELESEGKPDKQSYGIFTSTKSSALAAFGKELEIMEGRKQGEIAVLYRL